MNIADRFIEGLPSEQNLLNLFAGEWSSAMPVNSGLVSTPGHANLFDDPRIHWADEIFGGVKGKEVLELGPLEGAHSYMLHKLNAKKIISIEMNSRAYLKCLLVKEIFKLNRCDFQLGDGIEFVRNSGHFDVVFASGLLYHLADPFDLLNLLCNKTNAFFIWTHYYDLEVLQNRTDLNLFSPQPTYFKEELIGHERFYPGTALNWTGFSGGAKNSATWLSRKSMFEFISKRGFHTIPAFDHIDHPNGPAIAFCAIK